MSCWIAMPPCPAEMVSISTNGLDPEECREPEQEGRESRGMNVDVLRRK